MNILVLSVCILFTTSSDAFMAVVDIELTRYRILDREIATGGARCDSDSFINKYNPCDFVFYVKNCSQVQRSENQQCTTRINRFYAPENTDDVTFGEKSRPMTTVLVDSIATATLVRVEVSDQDDNYSHDDPVGTYQLRISPESIDPRGQSFATFTEQIITIPGHSELTIRYRSYCVDDECRSRRTTFEQGAIPQSAARLTEQPNEGWTIATHKNSPSTWSGPTKPIAFQPLGGLSGGNLQQPAGLSTSLGNFSGQVPQPSSAQNTAETHAGQQSQSSNVQTAGWGFPGEQTQPGSWPPNGQLQPGQQTPSGQVQPGQWRSQSGQGLSNFQPQPGQSVPNFQPQSGQWPSNPQTSDGHVPAQVGQSFPIVSDGSQGGPQVQQGQFQPPHLMGFHCENGRCFIDGQSTGDQGQQGGLLSPQLSAPAAHQRNDKDIQIPISNEQSQVSNSDFEQQRQQQQQEHGPGKKQSSLPHEVIVQSGPLEKASDRSVTMNASMKVVPDKVSGSHP